MAPSRDPKIVASIDLMPIEDFPVSGEPDGAHYILATGDGACCGGYLDGGTWVTDAGDPITPIYWGRIPIFQ